MSDPGDDVLAAAADWYMEVLPAVQAALCESLRMSWAREDTAAAFVQSLARQGFLIERAEL